MEEKKTKRFKVEEELKKEVGILLRRDFELSQVREEQEKELQELDRISKMLVRRDFELAETREKREKLIKELEETEEEKTIALIRERALAKDSEKKAKQLEKRLKELEETRNALMNILEDVDEARWKAEEEKNKTLTIINNFADGLLVFDKENRLSLINPQAEAFFDVKASDLIGGSAVLELQNFPTLQPLMGLLGPEIKSFFRKELPIRENLTLEVSAIPMMSGEEKLGTLVILHDVTREKRVERLKTEFVSLSAHQLRTPLSAIKWSLRMLLDGDAGRITKQQKDLIEKTYQSNERMIKLINDLLSVTRIEEGRYLFRLSSVNLEDIVQFVLNSYKEEIKKKKIKLTFEKSNQRLPRMKLDVEKMRLVIQNLLDNALRYTPKGGEIIIELKKIKNQIKFSIKDTGVGIPKMQQKRIFSKFFRAGNAIRMATEGSGLGLFVAKNIIESHKGKIWFESEENKGTVFYFTLPLENVKIKK